MKPFLTNRKTEAMRMISLLFAAILILPALFAAPAGADTARPAIAEDQLLAALPDAWEGFIRESAEYAAAPDYAGENGAASAHYRDQRGGTNFAEYFISLNDMGAHAGRMYQNFGADYLKGPISDDVQQSLEIAGFPALRTVTSDQSMMIVTFLPPGLGVTVSCIKASEDECRTVAGLLDFAALEALAASA